MSLSPPGVAGCRRAACPQLAFCSLASSGAVAAGPATDLEGRPPPPPPGSVPRRCAGGWRAAGPRAHRPLLAGTRWDLERWAQGFVSASSPQERRDVRRLAWRVTSSTETFAILVPSDPHAGALGGDVRLGSSGEGSLLFFLYNTMSSNFKIGGSYFRELPCAFLCFFLSQSCL